MRLRTVSVLCALASVTDALDNEEPLRMELFLRLEQL